jgi:hypothetical protein
MIDAKELRSIASVATKDYGFGEQRVMLELIKAAMKGEFSAVYECGDEIMSPKIRKSMIEILENYGYDAEYIAELQVMNISFKRMK